MVNAERREVGKIKEKMTAKNILIVFVSLIFASAVLVTSVMGATNQSFLSLNVLPAKTTTELTPTPTITPQPKVDYFLAYPGILPDNFLYPLKMIRDRILLGLTTDPVKRVEKLLLFADKRLGAGRALIEGGKTQLGIETLTKGEKYLEQAINQAEKAKQAGKETTGLYEKLAKASLKHQEVLGELVLKVPGETQAIINEVMKYPQAGYEKIIKILE
jgi:hypothetical protein